MMHSSISFLYCRGQEPDRPILSLCPQGTVGKKRCAVKRTSMQAKEKRAKEMGHLKLTTLTASKSRKMARTAGLRQLESLVTIVILFKSLSKPSRVVK